jgi:outer membrane protein TolC
MTLSYPLGQSAAEASYARAQVQIRQTQAQIEQMELQIATEVTNAGLQIQSSLRRIEAATAARELAQQQLDAEQSKFEVGASTNFFVVQFQRDLADAQRAELQAILDYQKARIEFDRAQRTSLAQGGIIIVTGGGN